MNKFEKEQKQICDQFGVKFLAAPLFYKLGISDNVYETGIVVNGLRHLCVDDTTGWYIWGGEEFSDASDFFKPIHVEHLRDKCPNIIKFLGLPPGWRFLKSGEYEDVWFDEKLLQI